MPYFGVGALFVTVASRLSEFADTNSEAMCSLSAVMSLRARYQSRSRAT
jgi:hypothetical protein